MYVSVPPECTDCVSFKMSLYKVIENVATWPEAKVKYKFPTVYK